MATTRQTELQNQELETLQKEYQVLLTIIEHLKLHIVSLKNSKLGFENDISKKLLDEATVAHMNSELIKLNHEISSSEKSCNDFEKRKKECEEEMAKIIAMQINPPAPPNTGIPLAPDMGIPPPPDMGIPPPPDMTTPSGIPLLPTVNEIDPFLLTMDIDTFLKPVEEIDAALKILEEKLKKSNDSLEMRRKNKASLIVQRSQLQITVDAKKSPESTSLATKEILKLSQNLEDMEKKIIPDFEKTISEQITEKNRLEEERSKTLNLIQEKILAALTDDTGEINDAKKRKILMTLKKNYKASIPKEISLIELQTGLNKLTQQETRLNKPGPLTKAKTLYDQAYNIVNNIEAEIKDLNDRIREGLDLEEAVIKDYEARVKNTTTRLEPAKKNLSVFYYLYQIEIAKQSVYKDEISIREKKEKKENEVKSSDEEREKKESEDNEDEEFPLIRTGHQVPQPYANPIYYMYNNDGIIDITIKEKLYKALHEEYHLNMQSKITGGNAIMSEKVLSMAFKTPPPPSPNTIYNDTFYNALRAFFAEHKSNKVLNKKLSSIIGFDFCKAIIKRRNEPFNKSHSENKKAGLYKCDPTSEVELENLREQPLFLIKDALVNLNFLKKRQMEDSAFEVEFENFLKNGTINANWINYTVRKKFPSYNIEDLITSINGKKEAEKKAKIAAEAARKKTEAERRAAEAAARKATTVPTTTVPTTTVPTTTVPTSTSDSESIAKRDTEIKRSTEATRSFSTIEYLAELVKLRNLVISPSMTSSTSSIPSASTELQLLQEKIIALEAELARLKTNTPSPSVTTELDDLKTKVITYMENRGFQGDITAVLNTFTAVYLHSQSTHKGVESTTGIHMTNFLSNLWEKAIEQKQEDELVKIFRDDIGDGNMYRFLERIEGRFLEPIGVKTMSLDNLQSEIIACMKAMGLTQEAQNTVLGTFAAVYMHSVGVTKGIEATSKIAVTPHLSEIWTIAKYLEDQQRVIDILRQGTRGGNMAVLLENLQPVYSLYKQPYGMAKIISRKVTTSPSPNTSHRPTL